MKRSRDYNKLRNVGELVVPTPSTEAERRALVRRDAWACASAARYAECSTGEPAEAGAVRDELLVMLGLSPTRMVLDADGPLRAELCAILGLPTGAAS